MIGFLLLPKVNDILKLHRPALGLSHDYVVPGYIFTRLPEVAMRPRLTSCGRITAFARLPEPFVRLDNAHRMPSINRIGW